MIIVYAFVGLGKSTAARALRARGLTTFDTDHCPFPSDQKRTRLDVLALLHSVHAPDFLFTNQVGPDFWTDELLDRTRLVALPAPSPRMIVMIAAMRGFPVDHVQMWANEAHTFWNAQRCRLDAHFAWLDYGSFLLTVLDTAMKAKTLSESRKS